MKSRCFPAAFFLAALAMLASAATEHPVTFPDLADLEPAVVAALAPLPEVVRAAEAAGDGEALGEAGRLYQAYGFLDSALGCYDAALAQAPEDFRWRFYRASVHAAAGRLDEATRSYQAALELQPADLAARIGLGEVLLALGRLPEARGAFEAARATAPETAAAIAGLGQVALSERRFEEAAGYLEQALVLAPQAGALRVPLAMAYRSLGRIDEARRQLELKTTVGVKAPNPLLAELETLKTGERVFLARGFRAFRAGDFAAAAASFREALAAQPASVSARVNLAAALERLGRQAEARTELERAVELAPDNPTARFNLGLLLLRAGEAGAVEQLAEVVRLRPEDVEAHRQLANALLVSGRLTEAVARLRQAHRDFPADGSLALQLTRLLVAAPDPALRDGAMALDLAGRLFAARASTEHATLVAAALAELDRCEEAAAWQERALKLASEEPGGANAAPALSALLSQYRTLRPCRLSLSPAQK